MMVAIARSEKRARPPLLWFACAMDHCLPKFVNSNTRNVDLALGEGSIGQLLCQYTAINSVLANQHLFCHGSDATGSVVSRAWSRASSSPVVRRLTRRVWTLTSSTQNGKSSSAQATEPTITSRRAAIA